MFLIISSEISCFYIEDKITLNSGFSVVTYFLFQLDTYLANGRKWLSEWEAPKHPAHWLATEKNLQLVLNEHTRSSSTSGQTDTQTDRQTETERQTDTQTERQTDRHTDRHTDRETESQTHRQTDRQTHRQTDTQTDRCNVVSGQEVTNITQRRYLFAIVCTCGMFIHCILFLCFGLRQWWLVALRVDHQSKLWWI